MLEPMSETVLVSVRAGPAEPVRLVRPKSDHFFSANMVMIVTMYQTVSLLPAAQPSVSQFAGVGPSPNQPKNVSFPKMTFGKAKLVSRVFYNAISIAILRLYCCCTS